MDVCPHVVYEVHRRDDVDGRCRQQRIPKNRTVSERQRFGLTFELGVRVLSGTSWANIGKSFLRMLTPANALRWLGDRVDALQRRQLMQAFADNRRHCTSSAALNLPKLLVPLGPPQFPTYYPCPFTGNARIWACSRDPIDLMRLQGTELCCSGVGDENARPQAWRWEYERPTGHNEGIRWNLIVNPTCRVCGATCAVLSK